MSTKDYRTEFLEGLYFGNELYECEKTPNSEEYRKNVSELSKCSKRLLEKMSPECTEVFEEFSNLHAAVVQEEMFNAFMQGFVMCSNFVRTMFFDSPEK